MLVNWAYMNMLG